MHCVGLARIGDAVAEYQQIVALEEFFKARIDGASKKVILRDTLLKHVRELKDCLRQCLQRLFVLRIAAAFGRIHRHARLLMKHKHFL